MNFETINVEINGPLGRLTLNRPERLNAMNATMLRELAEAARWFDERLLSDEEAAAYAAPFPSQEYQTAALVFPRLMPIRPDYPGAYDNRVAIEVLRTLELPVLLPWGAEDAITASAEAHLRSIFRNVAPPLSIKGAGHFIQEDAGEEVAKHIVEWMAAS